MPSDPSLSSRTCPVEQRVLVLPSTGADGAAIAKLFAASGIEFALCTGLSQLCAMLRVGAGTLIVSEEAITADGLELIACIDAQPVWSDLPIIVLSRSGRESSELAEIVGRLGNVSVIERPVRTSTLTSLVRSSLRARERQYQVRQYVDQQELAQQVVRESVDAERAARSEAERASRTKDEFLATLSHELRTPLNSILGWTQVMRKSRDLAKDGPNALTIIERNARSQAQIIQDLLDMSGIISGKVRLDLQRLDVAAVINATIETIRPTAQAKGIELHAMLDPMAGPIRGDPNRLQQVLWNLLTNAVKFTPKDGAIVVTLSCADSNLIIEVTDTGEGINPVFLPHVFDRFRQADNTSARRYGGLGLGLSIVKQLVELHGGSIEARSAGLKQGATFRISLPLMVTADDPAMPAAAREQPARLAELARIEELQETDLAGLKVLVVDDEVDARSLIERLLMDCNARVTTAASADDAMSALTRDTPDILISDIGMPGEDGYVLIRRVRELIDNVTIPAIALTAYARTEDRVKAIHAGFQLHLSKPVEPRELIAMVKSLARRYSASPNRPKDQHSF
jgi:signal transduction histidine kinase/ActR/RegA family two-component response regulator